MNDTLGQISYGKYDGVSPASYSSPVQTASIVILPSRTALVDEVLGPTGGPSPYHTYSGLVPHDGATNFLFADSHAVTLAYEAVPKNIGSNWRPAKSVIDQLDTFWNGQK
jgi:prepilin-type processing-associated H-X9-DG protein